MGNFQDHRTTRSSTQYRAAMERGKRMILTKRGEQLDHIGLATCNLEDTIADFEKRTGVKPDIHPPDPNLPFQNASVRLNDEGTFLEILGPNPRHRGVNPLKSLLRSMKEPTLWFWYVGTDDFEQLKENILRAGRSLENVVAQEDEGTISLPKSTYVGANIGPGFDPVLPSIIQWKKRSMTENSLICKVVDFSVSSTTYESDLDFLNQIGVSSADDILEASKDGRRAISLTIDTPKGSVTFANETKPVGISTVLACMFKDLCGCL